MRIPLLRHFAAGLPVLCLALAQSRRRPGGSRPGPGFGPGVDSRGDAADRVRQRPELGPGAGPGPAKQPDPGFGPPGRQAGRRGRHHRRRRLLPLAERHGRHQPDRHPGPGLRVQPRPGPRPGRHRHRLFRGPAGLVEPLQRVRQLLRGRPCPAAAGPGQGRVRLGQLHAAAEPAHGLQPAALRPEERGAAEADLRPLPQGHAL